MTNRRDISGPRNTQGTGSIRKEEREGGTLLKEEKRQRDGEEESGAVEGRETICHAPNFVRSEKWTSAIALRL